MADSDRGQRSFDRSGKKREDEEGRGGGDCRWDSRKGNSTFCRKRSVRKAPLPPPEYNFNSLEAYPYCILKLFSG